MQSELVHTRCKPRSKCIVVIKCALGKANDNKKNLSEIIIIQGINIKISNFSYFASAPAEVDYSLEPCPCLRIVVRGRKQEKPLLDKLKTANKRTIDYSLTKSNYMRCCHKQVCKDEEWKF